MSPPVPAGPSVSPSVPTWLCRSPPGTAGPKLALQVPTCLRQSLPVHTWLCRSPPVSVGPCQSPPVPASPHLSASVATWLYQSLFWPSQSLSGPVAPCLSLRVSAAPCEVSPCPFLLHPHVPSGLFALLSPALPPPAFPHPSKADFRQVMALPSNLLAHILAGLSAHHRIMEFCWKRPCQIVKFNHSSTAKGTTVPRCHVHKPFKSLWQWGLPWAACASA